MSAHADKMQAAVDNQEFIDWAVERPEFRCGLPTVVGGKVMVCKRPPHGTDKHYFAAE